MIRRATTHQKIGKQQKRHKSKEQSQSTKKIEGTYVEQQNNDVPFNKPNHKSRIMVCHKRFSSSRTSRRYFLTVITKRAYQFVNTAVQNPNDDCFFTSCHDLVIHVRRRQLA